uniref:Uncharacterized protein n=1 Tax=viral metagenome TaxID=1070528 RepID=A0A6M3XVB5_9ZZZZ
MANEIFAGDLGEIRLAGASKGVSLSTTAAYTSLPEGTHYVTLTPRNFATAVVARFALCPYLIVLLTTDALAASGNLTDYSSAAQDADTATSVVLSSLDTAANNDYLYVGSWLPFAGVHCDVDAANSVASALTVNYWDGTAWTTTSATDNTKSGTTTFAQDGTVTWSVPTDWVPDSLVDIGAATAGIGTHVGVQDIYWTRWQVSVQLDTQVTLDHMVGMPRSTAYAELLNGQAFEATINMGIGGVGGIVALTDAGTANLLINCSTRSSSRIFA